MFDSPRLHNTLTALIEKVNSQIARGIKTEAEAVYFMVQLRKLLENYEKDIRDRYPLMSFYSTWVVHTRLDRRHPGRREALKYFNQAAFIQTYLKGVKVEFPDKSVKVSAIPVVSKGLSFYPLRKEMGEFAHYSGLNSDFLSNRSWAEFVPLLVEALVNSPQLPMEGEFLPDSGDHLASFSFMRKLDSEYYQGDVEAIACWKITCKNGEIIEGPVYLRTS